jgi:hypothetical protein
VEEEEDDGMRALMSVSTRSLSIQLLLLLLLLLFKSWPKWCSSTCCKIRLDDLIRLHATTCFLFARIESKW